MRFSPTPDLGAPRRLVWTALAASLVVCALLVAREHEVWTSLGDTDDAMRVLRVRELLAGRGWYDQLEPRLQPPAGAWMHWSRLLDGGIAGLQWLFARVLTPDRAELAARIVWPLAWIAPAFAAGLVVARRLGPPNAVFVAAVLMAIQLQLFRQFTPGRVDHHNVQITATMIAMACALAGGRRRRWAAAAGLASGLGLAVGLEALPFHALIGMAYGLRLAGDRDEAPPALAYGLALAASALAAFAVQTPPWRWSLSACDAMGLNLALGLAAAGLGLALAAALGRRAPWRTRAALIGAAGLAAGAVYLGLDPACVHGPFAGLDPRVRPFWFDHIQEVRPFLWLLAHSRGAALQMGVVAAVVALAMAVIAGRHARADRAPLLLVACFAAALVAALQAWRMADYVVWFGMPALGAVYALAARRWLRDLFVPTTAAVVLASPLFAGAIATVALDRLAPEPKPAGGGDACTATAAFARLAALPRGVVLAETDLGPYVLANTPHASVTAPYHRLAGSILAAHEALDAPADQARARVAAVRATYVVLCGAPGFVRADSLAARLWAGQTPAWLEPRSGPGEALRVFAVRTPSTSR